MAVDQKELARRIRQDYLGHQSSNVMGSAATAIGRSAPVRWSLSNLGRLLDVLDTGLNVVTLGLKPIVTTIDPKLEEVYKREGFNITPSSLIEEAIPGKGVPKKIAKFAGDVLLDPITYTGAGLLTKGRVLKQAGALGTAAKEAKALGQGTKAFSIGLDSKLGKKLAKVLGRERATPQLIKEAKETGISTSLAEQARSGDRALLKFLGFPVIRGAKVFEIFETSRNLTRQNKYASAYRKLFVNHASNPEFDAMERNFINLLQYRKGEVIASARAIDDQLEEMVTKLGMPRDYINRLVTEVVERPTKPRAFIRKVVKRIAPEATEVKQQLVNTLRVLGQDKAAEFWAKKSPLSPEFKKFLKEAKVPGSPVARLLERGEVYTTIRDELNPLVAMIDDVTFINQSKGAKAKFMGLFVSRSFTPEERGLRQVAASISRLDLRNLSVNTRSTYLRRAYKEVAVPHSKDAEDRLLEIIAKDLAEHKTTIEKVVEDLFKIETPKPVTTKPIMPKTKLDELGPNALPDTRFHKLGARLKEKDLLETSIRPHSVLDYYTTHFYRPRTVAQAEGLEGTRKLRKGQLADVLKASRGDVFDKMENLINLGIIDNRHLLPTTTLHGSLNMGVLYNESEVLVKTFSEAQSIVPPGSIFTKRKNMTIIPRGEFEAAIGSVKRLLYETNQALPLMHGTSSLRKILDTGELKGKVPAGTGTQERDFAAGVLGSIFATVPTTSYGKTAIVLPISLLRGATALPGDGLFLPANAMIVKHLLVKGEEGIVDMSLRKLALEDWDEFVILGRSLAEIAEGKISTDPGIFQRSLASVHYQPDIHLTSPIPLSDALGTVPFDNQYISNLRAKGMDISRVQLVDRNGRYLSRFFDSGGNPILEQELLAAPNLGDIMSKTNLMGVAVNAERQAAAVEQFLKIAKVPEGESVYTYLRKTHPNIMNPSIEPLNPKAYDEVLDNYGLLSDESLNSLGANIFDLREGVLGKGLTAREVMSTPAGKLAATRIIVNSESFEKSLVAIPQYLSLPAEEKGKLAKALWRQIKAHERGHNVFTTSLRILPDELQYEFTDIAARALRLHAVRVGPKGKVIADDKLSTILRAYSKEGEEAAIRTIVGPKALKRIKKTPGDYAMMQSVVRKMVADVDELFAEAHSIYQLNPIKLKKIWPEAFGTMRKIYSRKGWKTEWITENTQIPSKTAIKYPEIADVANIVRRAEHDMIEIEAAAGIKVARLARDARGTQYTRHVVVREVRELLQSKFFKGARVWTDEMQAQITRKFRRISDKGLKDARARNVIDAEQEIKLRRKGGLKYLDKEIKEGRISRENGASIIHHMTVDEVNDLARQGKLRILGFQKVERFFDPDPVSQVRVRGIEGARAVTGHQYFQASKQWGIQSKTLQPGHRFVKPEALKGWQFPDEIADHIDRYFERVSIPKGLDPFIELFDNAQDTWKAWTLSIFPAYHTRNVVGNTWNNFLAGLVNPNYYKRAWDNLWGEIQGKGLDRVAVRTGYGKTYTLAETIDLMKQHDVWKVGQYGRDIDDLFQRELKGVFQHLKDNRVMQAGRQLGTFLESNAYMAHFIWRMEQGWSPAAAAQSVKKYLFDYADLTDFEKNVMKRVFPFYTWTRKNIPLQLEALVTQPGKPLGVLKAKMAYETNDDGAPDERYLPDWMVQNFPIRARFNKNTGNHEYFLLGSWLPVADIDRIFRPHRLMANMLTPFLKEPLQQFANYDFFSERPIDRGGEYERLVKVNMPKRISHILKNIRLIGEVDKLTKDELSVEAKLAGLATGKLYPYDVQKSRRFRKIETEQETRNLRGQLRRARRKGDKGEADRVLKAIRKHKKNQLQHSR